MIEQTCDLVSNQWTQIVILLLVFAWEAFLGRTTIVKPGSTAELIASVIVAVIRRLTKKGKSDEGAS